MRFVCLSDLDELKKLEYLAHEHGIDLSFVNMVANDQEYLIEMFKSHLLDSLTFLI